jgi:hypothetical protein
MEIRGRVPRALVLLKSTYKNTGNEDKRTEQLGMTRVIFIAGPTGVGKTRLGVDLALRFNGEVINADSIQVRRRSLALLLPRKHGGASHFLLILSSKHQKMYKHISTTGV